jgi:hypothetical protein
MTVKLEKVLAVWLVLLQTPNSRLANRSPAK